MTVGPTRGVILVRPVETEETVPGGKIILTEETRERLAADQVQLIEVGPGDVCENEHCSRPHETTISRNGHAVRTHVVDPRFVPEAWVLVQPRSFVDAGHETEKRYFARHDDVRAVFRVNQTET